MDQSESLSGANGESQRTEEKSIEDSNQRSYFCSPSLSLSQRLPSITSPKFVSIYLHGLETICRSRWIFEFAARTKVHFGRCHRRDYYSLHNRPYVRKSTSIRVHLKPVRTILRFNSFRVALRQVWQWRWRERSAHMYTSNAFNAIDSSASVTSNPLSTEFDARFGPSRARRQRSEEPRSH